MNKFLIICSIVKPMDMYFILKFKDIFWRNSCYLFLTLYVFLFLVDVVFWSIVQLHFLVDWTIKHLHQSTSFGCCTLTKGIGKPL